MQRQMLARLRMPPMVRTAAWTSPAKPITDLAHLLGPGLLSGTWHPYSLSLLRAY